MKAVDILEKAQLMERPTMRSGDTVRVHVKVREGDKERVQMYEGIVIGQPLADKLGLNTGDKVSLLINTSNGDVAQQPFFIRGIYNTHTPGFGCVRPMGLSVSVTRIGSIICAASLPTGAVIPWAECHFASSKPGALQPGISIRAS